MKGQADSIDWLIRLEMALVDLPGEHLKTASNLVLNEQAKRLAGKVSSASLESALDLLNGWRRHEIWQQADKLTGADCFVPGGQLGEA